VVVDTSQGDQREHRIGADWTGANGENSEIRPLARTKNRESLEWFAQASKARATFTMTHCESMQNLTNGTPHIKLPVPCTDIRANM
jgi:hypothetical protein